MPQSLIRKFTTIKKKFFEKINKAEEERFTKMEKRRKI